MESGASDKLKADQLLVSDLHPLKFTRQMIGFNFTTWEHLSKKNRTFIESHMGHLPKLNLVGGILLWFVQLLQFGEISLKITDDIAMLVDQVGERRICKKLVRDDQYYLGLGKPCG